jgi:hypothetical protein
VSRTPERRRRRLTFGVGRLLAVLAFTVVASTAGLYLVYQNYQVVRAGYLLDQELFRYRRELEIGRRLELQLALVKGRGEVTEKLKKELDMRRPTPADELLVPSPDPEKVTTAAPPAPLRGLP